MTSPGRWNAPSGRAADLRGIFQHVVACREALTAETNNTQPQSHLIRRARAELIGALETYTGALTANQLPIPYALRDELKLHRSIAMLKPPAAGPLPDQPRQQSPTRPGGDAAARLARQRSAANSLSVAPDLPASDLPFDRLTGVHRQEPGLVELRREMARAARTGRRLVLAVIQVNGLARINKFYGRAVGDRLLTQVAAALRASVRSYDLTMRYGGDEFICALPGQWAAVARQRLSLSDVGLPGLADMPPVRVGVAEMLPDDTAQQLIDRALIELGERQSGPMLGRLPAYDRDGG